MFRKINILSTIVSGLIAGILFSITTIIYVYHATYKDTWLLYLGSFLFGVAMWIHTMRDSKTRGENESTVALCFASHVATMTGIIISVILSFIILSLMVPGYLSQSTPDKIQTGEPANIIHDKTEGLSFQVFFAATVINFSIGSFIGIILPFYIKKNQTKDSRDPAPLHQRGSQ